MEKLTFKCKCGKTIVEPATEIHVRCPDCARVYNRIDSEEYKKKIDAQ